MKLGSSVSGLEIQTKLTVPQALDLLERALLERGARDIDRGQSYVAFGKFKRGWSTDHNIGAIRSGSIAVEETPSGLKLSSELHFDHLVTTTIGAAIFFALALRTLFTLPVFLVTFVLVWCIIIWGPYHLGHRRMRSLIDDTLLPHRFGPHEIWTLR
jgi:hypothetical protein